MDLIENWEFETKREENRRALLYIYSGNVFEMEIPAR